jgi:hypothetical protein
LSLVVLVGELAMAGFDAPIIEYPDDAERSDVERKRPAIEYIRERKLLVDFIINFRRGREAFYRYDLGSTF